MICMYVHRSFSADVQPPSQLLHFLLQILDFLLLLQQGVHNPAGREGNLILGQYASNVILIA